jgi:threonylcarbamoyladenosine tRNA methylthiotransferase MtaB
LKFHLQTFGCKTNRYDAEAIAQLLVGGGHLRVSDPSAADIQIVNTCAVTYRAEAKAVRYIRKVGRKSGEAPIVVVGCAVEREPDKFSKLPGVDLSLGTKEKYDLLDLLGQRGSKTLPHILTGGIKSNGNTFGKGRIEHFEGRRRAFLKIQDGCDYPCTYCIVPSVRGRSVSRSPGEIVDEARSLIAAGFKEIVLTGIHIGLYGRDLSPRNSIVNLVELLLSETDEVRFRLSSVDAQETSDDLIQLVTGSKRICSHLHIPLQSGSPSVLKTMARKTSVDSFREVCMKAMKAESSIGLGTDVIIGFPGESETDFELTRKVIQETPFSYVHIFPFSPRPGTPACEMTSGMLQDSVIRERVKELKTLVIENGEEFRERQVGIKEEVVVERKKGTWYEGRCSNYLKAYIQTDRITVGEKYGVRIEKRRRDGVEVSLL